jgi:hypothetical protein
MPKPKLLIFHIITVVQRKGEGILFYIVHYLDIK